MIIFNLKATQEQQFYTEEGCLVIRRMKLYNLRVLSPGFRNDLLKIFSYKRGEAH